MFEVAFIASTISKIALNALGPDEQPKSAIPIFIIGQLFEHTISLIAFSIACFVNDIIFFYKKLFTQKEKVTFSLIVCVFLY
jgi:hypothetical protein